MTAVMTKHVQPKDFRHSEVLKKAPELLKASASSAPSLVASSAPSSGPSDVTLKIETAAIAKANLRTTPLILLSIMAGMFIALGAIFFAISITGSTLGFGPTKVFGGIAFSLGLVLVVVAGGELFTGNNLIVLGWADHKIPTILLLRNWAFSFCFNLVGAFILAYAIISSGLLLAGDGALGQTFETIAFGKLTPSYYELFMRGVLCNFLVCLAIFLSASATNIGAKILAIIFPIAAFVAAGFEHSIANGFLIPVGLVQSYIATGQAVDWGFVASSLWTNLVPVTLGNIVGGAVLVAGAYYMIYLKKR